MKQTYLESSQNNRYAGKNIKLSNGSKFYVTDNGYYKSYSNDVIYDMTAGKNGCPTELVSAENDEVLKKLIEGTPMIEGQGCGISGKNIYVTEPTRSVKSIKDLKNIEYVGCYKNNDKKLLKRMSRHTIYASNDSKAFDTGYQMAQENGKSYFSIWKNRDNKYEMYMGNVGPYSQVPIKEVINIFDKELTPSYITAVSWKSETKGAEEALFTPWGTVELRNSRKKIIWKSSAEPIEPCRADYDNLDKNSGSLNLTSDFWATYGFNCNGKPKYNKKWQVIGTSDVRWNNFQQNVQQWVEETDLSKNSKFVIDNNNAKRTRKYPDVQTTDPAYGCGKDFSTLWYCGTKENYKYVSPSAAGKVVDYDCSKEEKLCTFTYEMNDDGNFTISRINNNKKEVVWSTNTKDKVNMSNKVWDGSKGYKGKSTFVSGKDGIISLKRGEFIGSPSGNCRITLTKEGMLEVQYYMPGCEDISSEKNSEYGKRTIGMSDAMSLYRIKGVGNGNLGKVGYIDENLKLHEYPQSLLEFGDKYMEKKDYHSDISRSNTIKTLRNVSPDQCKEECNKDKNCAGFNYNHHHNKNEGECKLGNLNMYPKVHEVSGPKSDQSIFIRERKVKNHHSCSVEVIPVQDDEWNKYFFGDKMTATRLCSLGVISKHDYSLLSKKGSEIQELVKEMNRNINILLNEKHHLKDKLVKTKRNLDHKLKEFSEQYEKLEKIEKRDNLDNLNTLSAMFDVSKISVVMEENKSYVFLGLSAVLLFTFLNIYRRRTSK